MSLLTGCSASGTSDNAPAPSTTPEQGAANPVEPATPLEPSEFESESEGGTPDSGADGSVSGADPDTESDPEPNPGSEPEPTPMPVTRAECVASPSDIQSRMLELINETRASARNCGTDAFAAADPLTWSDTLEEAAAGHSLDMSSVNFFSHTGSNGSNIVARAEAVNYHYRNLGENLAAGQRTAADAMQGLVDSPGHCANLMNPAYREVGVACSADSASDYRFYWTQVFGRQQ